MNYQQHLHYAAIIIIVIQKKLSILKRKTLKSTIKQRKEKVRLIDLNISARLLKGSVYLKHMDNETINASSKSDDKFQSLHKIGSYIIRAELYPLKRKVKSLKYVWTRNEVCNFIFETNTFSRSVTGETSRINRKL